MPSPLHPSDGVISSETPDRTPDPAVMLGRFVDGGRDEQTMVPCNQLDSGLVIGVEKYVRKVRFHGGKSFLSWLLGALFLPGSSDLKSTQKPI